MKWARQCPKNRLKSPNPVISRDRGVTILKLSCNRTTVEQDLSNFRCIKHIMEIKSAAPPHHQFVGVNSKHVR